MHYMLAHHFSHVPQHCVAGKGVTDPLVAGLGVRLSSVPPESDRDMVMPWLILYLPKFSHVDRDERGIHSIREGQEPAWFP